MDFVSYIIMIFCVATYAMLFPIITKCICGIIENFSFMTESILKIAYAVICSAGFLWFIRHYNIEMNFVVIASVLSVVFYGRNNDHW